MSQRKNKYELESYDIEHIDCGSISAILSVTATPNTILIQDL